MQAIASLALVGAAMAAALWTVPTGEVVLEGKATHYSAEKMAATLAYRRVSLAGYVGPVVLNRRGDLWRKVWLEWEDGLVEGPFLVVDCAQRGVHYEERVRKGLVVEVSEEQAARRGFAWWGPVPVRVWFADPRGPEGGGRWM